MQDTYSAVRNALQQYRIAWNERQQPAARTHAKTHVSYMWANIVNAACTLLCTVVSPLSLYCFVIACLPRFALSLAWAGDHPHGAVAQAGQGHELRQADVLRRPTRKQLCWKQNKINAKARSKRNQINTSVWEWFKWHTLAMGRTITTNISLQQVA